MKMKTSRARRVPGSVLAAVAAGALLLLAGCEKSGAPVTQPDTAAAILLENIRRHQRGEPLTDVVDRSRGY